MRHSIVLIALVALLLVTACSTELGHSDDDDHDHDGDGVQDHAAEDHDDEHDEEEDGHEEEGDEHDE